jgi:hypothetical protein
VRLSHRYIPGDATRPSARHGVPRVAISHARPAEVEDLIPRQRWK